MSAEDGIRRAIQKYIQTHDVFDTEGLVQLWAEDGLFVTPRGEFRGHASIREFHEARRERAEPGVESRMLSGDPLITVNGTTAEALTSVIGLRRANEEPWAVAFFAQWADTFVERGDRWLFTERRVLYP
jgi:SnoaL-like domain